VHNRIELDKLSAGASGGTVTFPQTWPLHA
jgi:hypothetical protein